jgi:HK97 family phage major capsid protein
MTLTAKRGELETLKARAQAIIDQYGAGGLTAEKNIELTTLTTKCVELAGEIKAERELDEKKRDLNSLDEFLNSPQYKIPHGADNGEDDTHKALRQGGWEVKGGMIYAPTSTGKMLAMYPEETLFGEIPKNDPDAAQFFKQTRGAMQPEYRRAYTAWLQNLAKAHGSESMAYTMLGADEQKALSEGTDTAGGFLVPPDVQAELLVRKAQVSAVRRAGARVQATSRDILKYPMVQANVTSGSIYSSGFVGSVAGETPTASDVDAAFGSFDVAIKKIRVSTKLSNDFIADAVVNVLSFLAMNGATNMALVEDNEFITGDGSALHPQGILNGGVSQVDLTVGGVTTHVFSNDSTHPGPAKALVGLVYQLPPQYAEGAVWLMRRSIEGAVRQLVDGSNRFLWPPMIAGGFSAVTRELMGYPIYGTDFVPADAVADANIMIFGDMSSYIIGERAQITSTVLRERYADNDQTGLILWERVGGAVWNPDGLRLGYALT